MIIKFFINKFNRDAEDREYNQKQIPAHKNHNVDEVIDLDRPVTQDTGVTVSSFDSDSLFK